MTDLERAVEFAALLGIKTVPYQSTVAIKFWRPKPGSQDDVVDDNRRDEIYERERRDTRKCTWLSISQAHLIFDESGKFKGVLDDEMCEYTPTTKGDGYWDEPPELSEPLQRPAPNFVSVEELQRMVGETFNHFRGKKINE